MADSRGTHPSQRRYPPKLRERAVRMVLETFEQTGTRTGVITRIARQLGIGTESLRSWVRQAEVDGGLRPGTSTQDKERIAALEREVRELRRTNEILRDRFGVEPICRALQVAPSSYYAARCRPPSARASSDAELAPKILRVFNDNYQVYGTRKLWRQLRREGELVGRDRVARLMRTLGIAGAVRGRPRRTTIPDPAAARAPDLVNRQFTATRPNQLWVSDFTYVATWSGTV